MENKQGIDENYEAMRADRTPRCPECNAAMVQEDDRDEEGNLTQAPWWHCPNCGHNQ